MRRTIAWLSSLALVLVAGGAAAAPTGFASADGDWSDWFTYGGSVANTDWDQANAAANLMDPTIRWANAPTASHNGGAGLTDGDGTNPAYGGQLYDVEQIFYYYEDYIPGSDSPANATGGILHVGLVTGFPPGGTTDFLAGDLFFGFGSTGALDFALGVSTHASDAGRLEQVYLGTEHEPVAYPAHSISQPYRMDITDPGTSNVTAGFGGANVTVAWGGDGVSEATLAGGSATHYFLEVAIELDGGFETQITDPDFGGIKLHWTMGCGNDYIDVNDNVPFDPVPEPSTLVLLGMGVLGVALRARRPQC